MGVFFFRYHLVKKMSEKSERCILAGTLKDRNLAETYVLVQNLNPMVQRLLANDPNFSEMRVLGFQLTPEDIQAVAYALSENKTLKALSLDHLQIGDEGIKQIAEGLCYNESLTYISLRWNDIGNEGGMALADALHYNKHIKQMIVAFNNLGNPAGHSFAEALKKNTSLEKLDLKWNQIEDDVGDILLTAMSENKGALSTLMLGGNGSSLRNARKNVKATSGRNAKSTRFKIGLGGKDKKVDDSTVSLEQLKKDLAGLTAEIEDDEDARELQEGDLVEILDDPAARRGRVRYIGETDFEPGIWVGIEFDSPVGKNDGSFNGKQYFSCPPKHGSFFNPDKLVLLEEVLE